MIALLALMVSYLPVERFCLNAILDEMLKVQLKLAACRQRVATFQHFSCKRAYGKHTTAYAISSKLVDGFLSLLVCKEIPIMKSS